MRTRYASLALFLALATSGVARAAPLDCKLPAEVALDKIEARAVIVGEVHGTEETPAFVGQLVCGLLKQGRPVIVALERNGAEQEALNRYLASAGQPVDQQALLSARAWATPKAQDGRSSRAMLQLIEQVRQWRRDGQRVGVLAMQQDSHVLAPMDGTPRLLMSETDMNRLSEINDRSMADKVWSALAAHPGYTVVALAGNVHTALGSKMRAQFASTPSFADVLSSYVPVHVIGLTSSKGGSSWNMTSKGIGRGPMMPGPHYMADARIDSLVDLGEISASTPATQAR